MKLLSFQNYLLFFLLLFSTAGVNANMALPPAFDFEVWVTDEQGNPLVGVNVYTEDLSFTGSTDEDGKVLLSDVAYSTEVIFSYVGFTTLKMPFYRIRQQGGQVTMYPALDVLPTITVIGRRDERPEEIPYQVGAIPKKDIAFFNSQTTSDALMQNENVFVQKSQMGGGSINIRGFEANKVLLVVDGVRLNNIIYRSGHLQDAIKVDNAMLERIEVIYGPGSLNYGSDALGGVVHFRTRDPKLLQGGSGTDHEISGNAFGRFSSANVEKTLHFDLNYGTEKWGSLTSFSYSDYDDLRAGDNRPEAYPDFGKRERQFFREPDGDAVFSTLDPNVQSPTGYSQFDLLQKFLFRSGKYQTTVLNFQYSTSTDVPRYDFLTNTLPDGSLEFSEWYYGPQQRLLASARFKSLKPRKLADRSTVIAAFQRIDEDRYQRRAFNAWRSFTLEDVYIYSLTADLDKRLGPNGRTVLTYGLDLTHNTLLSDAGQVNVRSGEVAEGVMTRYPSGGSDQTTLAGYANLRWQTRDSLLTLFAGGRYTWVRLFSQYRENDSDPIFWPDYFYSEGLYTVNSAFTWSSGLTIRTPKGTEVRILGSTAFHAPNVDDFAKFRERNNFITIPNPDLGPESTINAELAVGQAFGGPPGAGGFGGKVQASGFYTFLTDAIVRQNFQLPNGDTTFFSDGNLFRVQASVNAKEAFIRGLSARLDLHYGDRWSLVSALNYAEGRIVEDGEETGPLDHIPPLFGRTELNYRREKMRLAFVVRYNAAKPVAEYAGGGEDNLEYATEDGTYAWTTYNLYSSFDLSPALSLEAALENITDLHYRPFSSGTSAAGRNLILTLRAAF